MNFLETDKIILFILFAIPGLISIKTYQLITPGSQRPIPDEIIDALFYSSLNYALLFVPIIYIENSEIAEKWPFLYFLFYIFVFILAPASWAILWKYARTRDILQRHAPHPTTKPWDFVFSQKKWYWVKVYLKDGKVIGGFYGSDSFTSSSPSNEQIYLQESWIINYKGGFERKKNDSAGVIVISDEISHIELVSYDLEKSHDA